jgi:hypothetical protein
MNFFGASPLECFPRNANLPNLCISFSNTSPNENEPNLIRLSPSDYLGEAEGDPPLAWSIPGADRGEESLESSPYIDDIPLQD